MTVKIKKTHPDAVIPRFAHGRGDSGMDLHSVEATTLLPGERKLVKTGISLQMPEGLEGQVRPRSGNALKRGLTVLNSPGTIDSSYTGDVGVILVNLGDALVTIEKGDKIAQLVFAKVEHPELVETDSLDDTVRGANGFGSTGV